VFEGVSASVRQGERVLIEGPSGAGKSTMLAIMAGLRPADGGEVTWSAVPDGAGGHRPPRVIAVPQFHRNHVFTGTVSFNVLMGRGWPAHAVDERMAEDICRELGLGPLLDRMPSGMGQMLGETGWRLSHGERSRIFIARALAQQPDVLLLDESLTALDAQTTHDCVDAIMSRCPTVVLVAHP
jgi:ATP-binding cassette, subfamily B, bacterial